MEILLATHNSGKAVEVKSIFNKYNVVTMKDVGLTMDVEETGSTFEENALIKARSVYNMLDEEMKKKYIVMADDSGLEVDYLNKAPGIYSARYMGEETPYTIKNNHIIKLLYGVKDEDRTARFVCAIAVVRPDGSEDVVRGTIEGRIAYEEKGEHGFGYDPIFFLPEYGCTSAEIPPEEKNRISHRANALQLIKDKI